MLHHPVVFFHGLFVPLAVEGADVAVRSDLTLEVGAEHRVASVHQIDPKCDPLVAREMVGQWRRRKIGRRDKLTGHALNTSTELYHVAVRV
jgi:hypothetical protein